MIGLFNRSRTLKIPEKLENFLSFFKKNPHLNRENNTLFHWGVLLDKPDWLKKKDAVELEKKNSLGFTPLELAKVLNRQACISILSEEKGDILPVEKEGKINYYTEEEFGKLMDIKYTKNLYVNDLKILEKVVKRCKKGERKGWITIGQKWFGTLHGEEIFKSSFPKISLRWLNSILGYGVFAEKDFVVGEYIGEYTGLLKKRTPRYDKYNSYCFEYLIGNVKNTPYHIDAQDQGNFTRFINHSDEPNLSSIGGYYGGIMHICFKAIKPIAKGSQLTYDYGVDYWSRREVPRMPEKIEELE